MYLNLPHGSKSSSRGGGGEKRPQIKKKKKKKHSRLSTKAIVYFMKLYFCAIEKTEMNCKQFYLVSSFLRWDFKKLGVG